MKTKYSKDAFSFLGIGALFSVLSLGMILTDSGTDEYTIAIAVIMFFGSVGFLIYGLLYLIRLRSPSYVKKLEAKERTQKAKDTIAKVYMIGYDSKASTGSAVGRAIIGDFVAGGVGAVVGASTAHKYGMTKFLIEYEDGHRTVETVKDNSTRFKKLIQYVGL